MYYHSIVKHAPIQFRLFSGRTANTVKEEAMFTAMKRDSNNSSNFHRDNVMKNIIIRAQARSKIEHTSRKSNQSYLIYIAQLSYSYKIPSSVITGLNDINLSFNVFWKDKLTFFKKTICSGSPKMMVLFLKTH